MDEADPNVQKQILAILDRTCTEACISHHDLRQRFDGHSFEVDVHLVFPDSMPIVDAHRVATKIELAIENELQPGAHVTTHLEPRDDHKHAHPDTTI